MIIIIKSRLFISYVDANFHLRVSSVICFPKRSPLNTHNSAVVYIYIDVICSETQYITKSDLHLIHHLLTSRDRGVIPKFTISTRIHLALSSILNIDCHLVSCSCSSREER